MPIESLLWPESVAIVGASTNPRAPGGKLFEVLRQYGFEGRLFATQIRRVEKSLPALTRTSI